MFIHLKVEYMTTEIFEIPADLENDNLYFVYFLYNSLGDILYIGKTTNLRARMRQHLVSELVKLEPWRGTVDKNNIVTVQCLNACDMDLYETYFINKYKPIYNKDKIFNSSASFEFPYITPVTYKFKLKVVIGDGSFKDNCLTYIENEDEREFLAAKYPLIKQSFDELGAIRMKAVNYLPNKLIDELHFRDIKNQELIKADLVQQLEIGADYSLEQLKTLVNEVYAKYNINKPGKAVDINNYFETRRKSSRYGSKTIKVLEILKVKE